eukprot:56761-Alexandrium_andersonii.AAC.1
MNHSRTGWSWRCQVLDHEHRGLAAPSATATRLLDLGPEAREVDGRVHEDGGVGQGRSAGACSSRSSSVEPGMLACRILVANLDSNPLELSIEAVVVADLVLGDVVGGDGLQVVLALLLALEL